MWGCMRECGQGDAEPNNTKINQHATTLTSLVRIRIGAGPGRDPPPAGRGTTDSAGIICKRYGCDRKRAAAAAAI